MGVQSVYDGHRLPIPSLVDRNRDALLFTRYLFTDTDFFWEATFWAYITHLCSPSSCMIVRILAMDCRNCLIFPGDGDDPPIADIPRSCISSSFNSFSFSPRSSGVICRSSLTLRAIFSTLF